MKETKIIEQEIISLLKNKTEIDNVFYDDMQKLIRFIFGKYEMTISVDACEMSYDVLVERKLI